VKRVRAPLAGESASPTPLFQGG